MRLDHRPKGDLAEYYDKIKYDLALYKKRDPTEQDDALIELIAELMCLVRSGSDDRDRMDGLLVNIQEALQ